MREDGETDLLIVSQGAASDGSDRCMRQLAGDVTKHHYVVQDKLFAQLLPQCWLRLVLVIAD